LLARSLCLFGAWLGSRDCNIDRWYWGLIAASSLVVGPSARGLL
jgi:hypothetical protein